MSRTYRRSGINDRYRNIESYEKCRTYRYQRYFQPKLFFVDDARWYFQNFHDGKPKKYNHFNRKGYKDSTNEAIRNSNKENARKIKRNVDSYDEMNYCSKKSEKYRYWSYD